MSDTSEKQSENTLKIAEMSMKTALTINGGAALALLTFIGNSSSEYKSKLATALLVFALGVFLSGISTCTSFLAQRNYLIVEIKQQRPRKTSYFTYASITLVAASYLSFVFGVYFSYCGFKI